MTLALPVLIIFGAGCIVGWFSRIAHEQDKADR